MLKMLWKTTLAVLATACLAPSVVAESLRIELDVIEANCGPNGRQIAVCEELWARLEGPFEIDVDAFNRKATNRSGLQVIVPVDGECRFQRNLVSGTLTVELEVSAIRSGQVTLGIQWELKAPDDSTYEGYTQARSRIGGDRFVFSSGSQTNTYPNGESSAVVRVMSLRVSEALSLSMSPRRGAGLVHPCIGTVLLG
jgi:hypothetical protein